MNSTDQADLKTAEAMRGTEFNSDGQRHRIEDAFFAHYADEVVVEVRVWSAPGRSHIETWNLRQLHARMGK